MIDRFLDEERRAHAHDWDAERTMFSWKMQDLKAHLLWMRILAATFMFCTGIAAIIAINEESRHQQAEAAESAAHERIEHTLKDALYAVQLTCGGLTFP